MNTAARGMTLIELLVAMTIGLGLTLAVSSLLITGQNHNRTTTSTNDAEQTGAYAFYALDRILRGAGSSFADSAYPSDRGVLGCRLNVNTLLPRAGAYPAPFATNFSTATTENMRVAPVLIGPNQSDGGSDVLIVMSGAGGAGGVPRQVTGGGDATSLILDNTVGLFVNDLTLVSQSGTDDCLLEQVTVTNSPPTLGFNGGAYYTAGAPTSLATLASSTSTYVTPIGNAQANNVQFLMFGVDANRTLWSYDLLQNAKVYSASGADTSQAVADGVDQMHAIYGIDSSPPLGVQSAWASPSLDAGYDIASVMSNPVTMRKIISVRVALLLRGEYYDKNLVSPATLTLFAGLTNAANVSLAQTVNLTADQQHYRYRVFEFTVPLRNMLLLAGASAS